MDVWIPIIVGKRPAENRPVWLVGSGERRHSFIAVSDVAEFALAAIGNQTARNRRIPLGGPVAISWRDIIALVEERSDQPIPVNSVPMGQVPPELSELITGLLTGLEMGEVIIPMEKTARTFGVRQTTPEQFIQMFCQSPSITERSPGLADSNRPVKTRLEDLQAQLSPDQIKDTKTS